MGKGEWVGVLRSLSTHFVGMVWHLQGARISKILAGGGEEGEGGG